jgi:PAS domain-containing protein
VTGALPNLEVFKPAVEASGKAILITSAELDEPGSPIEYANPTFTRMTGYETHEIPGRSPRFVQSSRTDRASLDRLRASLEAGEAVQG